MLTKQKPTFFLNFKLNFISEFLGLAITQITSDINRFHLRKALRQLK